MFMSRYPTTSPNGRSSAVSSGSISDGFSDAMVAHGLQHKSHDGREVFLHANDLPAELDLFQFNDIFVSEDGAGDPTVSSGAVVESASISSTIDLSSGDVDESTTVGDGALVDASN